MVNDHFQKELKTVFEELNDFIDDHNRAIRDEGGLTIKKQTIKIVGQTALLFGNLPFPVNLTMDLDIVTPLSYEAQKKLEELLLEKGIRLDSDSRLIWMPERTKYHQFTDHQWVKVYYAEPKAVIMSKYRFSRKKDKKLIETYLGHFPEVNKVLKKIKQIKGRSL